MPTPAPVIGGGTLLPDPTWKVALEAHRERTWLDRLVWSTIGFTLGVIVSALIG